MDGYRWHRVGTDILKRVSEEQERVKGFEYLDLNGVTFEATGSELVVTTRRVGKGGSYCL